MWRTGVILISALINRLHYSVTFTEHSRWQGSIKISLQTANNIQLLRNLLRSAFPFLKRQAFGEKWKFQSFCPFFSCLQSFVIHHDPCARAPAITYAQTSDRFLQRTCITGHAANRRAIIYSSEVIRRWSKHAPLPSGSVRARAERWEMRREGCLNLWLDMRTEDGFGTVAICLHFQAYIAKSPKVLNPLLYIMYILIYP